MPTTPKFFLFVLLIPRFFCTFAVMKRLVYVLLAVALFGGGLLLGGCGESPRRAALLERTDSLMASRPDAALALLDSLLADSGHLSAHFAMQCRLRRLNAINKLDTVFTPAHVALAQTLTEHFDEHGTPNERMLAHYLLGHTFADTGEAPQALSSFWDAVNSADTTNKDCDYGLLCRVYSQMATLSYRQNLMVQSLTYHDISVDYAWRVNDSLAALNSLAHKMLAFERLQKTDSVIITFENIYKGFFNKYRQQVSRYLCLPVESYLKKGRFKMAKQCLDLYETESGYFDKDGHIESGREAFYNVKGKYFMAVHQYDSAEYYFRQELRYGKNFINQNMASQDLALYYRETDNPDSAAKYALYSYAMNDSAYAQMETAEVLRFQSLYNYTRQRQIAFREKEKAKDANNRLLVFALLAVAVVSVSLFLFTRYKAKRKAEYESRLRDLLKAQSDILLLRSSKDELGQILSEKENELEHLKQELFQFEQNKKKRDKSELELKSTSAYLEICRKTDYGQDFSTEDWDMLNTLLIKLFPSFYQFVTERRFALTVKEYQMCVLLRLHFKPSTISNVINVTPSFVTKMSKSLLKKFFEMNGTTKDLYQELLKI